MSAAAETSSEQQAPSIEEVLTQQYLTFIMADEEYGVDILAVQEIRGWERATMVPNSPSHMKGVLNLRGTIVPIIDLRDRFLLDAIEYTDATVVVILKVDTDKGPRTMGIVVDAISDVYDVPLKDIRTAGIQDNQNSQFMLGMVTVNESVFTLLELEKLLTIDE